MKKSTFLVTAVLALSPFLGARAQQSGAASSVSANTSAQMQQAQASAMSQDDKRTAKQKLLDGQAQRLVNMANELKIAVDKTNKNILSLDVVRKAEDIEALAHEMKAQVKR